MHTYVWGLNITSYTETKRCGSEVASDASCVYLALASKRLVQQELMVQSLAKQGKTLQFLCICACNDGIFVHVR